MTPFKNFEKKEIENFFGFLLLTFYLSGAYRMLPYR